MRRKLSAIEIAEGALLADIAVVFQLLTLYLPIGGDFFRVLVFIVFAVLVLRRGLYVGIMGMCVAIFLSAIVGGPQFVVVLLLEGMGGLFLGFTMKRRFSHILLLLIGITGGAFATYSVLFLTTFLFGLPFKTLIIGLRNAYNGSVTIVDLIAKSIGLSDWWRHTVFPAVTPVIEFGFRYWWALYYVAIWLLLCPFVVVIYATTNTLVRRLGYEVRPFPSGRLNKRLRRLSRSLLRAAARQRRLNKQRAVRI